MLVRVKRALVLVVLTGCGTPDPQSATDAANDAPAIAITCTGAQAGPYCGGDQVTGGDPATLYDCPGPDQAPTSSMACALGCTVEPAGTADRCEAAVESYRLPWSPATTMQLTQDCNDSCCQDHVGNDAYAWDWANGGGFAIHAARGGTVTHLKINSTTGCGTSACSNDVNFIVIDHGDGSQATYLHLQGNTLAAGITCGGVVARGQALATAGTTGYSTGVHLHFQVNSTNATAPTCECGADGTGCGATTVPWADFWATASHPATPVVFDEWPAASQCGNRRMAMPASQNP